MSASKYALVERERRFLVAALPPDRPTARRTITDLYVDGARIRVRRTDGIVAGAPETARKLTQKVPDAGGTGGRRGTITTIYLDETEYDLLSRLPGRWLTKMRLSHPPTGVDVFEGVLAGLIIAEVAFDDDAAMASFVAPAWCGREVTDHAGFTGANLARLASLAPSEGPDDWRRCCAPERRAVSRRAESSAGKRARCSVAAVPNAAEGRFVAGETAGHVACSVVSSVPIRTEANRARRAGRAAPTSRRPPAVPASRAARA